MPLSLHQLLDVLSGGKLITRVIEYIIGPTLQTTVLQVSLGLNIRISN